MNNHFISTIALLIIVWSVSGCGNCSGKLSPEAERSMYDLSNGATSTEYEKETEAEQPKQPKRSNDGRDQETRLRDCRPDNRDEGMARVETGESLAWPARLTNVPEQVLRRKAYVLSFNTETLLPNWVAWKLTSEETDGPWKRKSAKFHEDFDIDPKYQVFPSDYNRSGYDRGHMCPAGDNKWDKEAMRECFLMTNICPQLHSLNSGDWNSLEIQCRDWARQYGEIYIVCGPIFSKKSNKKIGRPRRVTVPVGFFKVILCMKGSPKAIGFVFKNMPGHHARNEYVNTVDDVERIVNMDFFPALPDRIENRVEAKANLDDW